MRAISFLSITRTVEVSPLVEDIRSLILCSTKLPHHKAVSEKDTRSSHKCVARRAKGAISPKCSENMVIMCIARCFSKQNNVFPRRSNILAPKIVPTLTNLGWQQQCHRSTKQLPIIFVYHVL